MRSALAVAMLVGLASGAEAATIVNGSVDAGSFRGPGRGGPDRAARAKVAGLAAVPGWTIFGAGPADGVNDFDLAAPGAGGIVQRTGGLAIGHTHRLPFDLLASPLGLRDRRHGNRMGLSPTAMMPRIHGDVPGDTNAVSNMRHERYSHDFTAARESRLVRLSNPSPDGFGAVIDDVPPSIVPNVTNWGLLLAGFGLVGAVARRRRYTRTVSA